MVNKERKQTKRGVTRSNLILLVLALYLLLLVPHRTGLSEASAQNDSDELASTTTEAPSADESDADEYSDSDDAEEETTETTTATPNSRFDLKAFAEVFSKRLEPTFANNNSGVEKGTKTELPKEPVKGERSSSQLNQVDKKLGVVKHTENPKARAEPAKGPGFKKAPKKGASGAKSRSSEISTETPTTEPASERSTTEAPDSEDEKSDSAESRSGELSTKAPLDSTTTEAPSSTTERPKSEPSTERPAVESSSKAPEKSDEESDENADSRSGELSTETSPVEAAHTNAAGKEEAPPQGSTTEAPTSEPSAKESSGEPSSAATSERSQVDLSEDEFEKVMGNSNLERLRRILELEQEVDEGAEGGGSSRASALPEGKKGDAGSGDLSNEIKKLSEEGRTLEGRRNKTIMINGRKFDQLASVECVDARFFDLLMNDLRLIEPSAKLDHYGSYYDYEYAKAITAIVDTPTTQAGERNAQVKPEKSDKGNILKTVYKFWNVTRVTYRSVDRQLDKRRLPIGQLMADIKLYATKTPSFNAGPEHKRALANHQYLLGRLEQLKAMLLEAEEALVVLNNRVKKLNVAVGEAELQRALSSCVAARAGRAAMMIMNELFVDKQSEKLLGDLESAKKRAQAAALDTAEFCSYWYGDTIRSQVVQKERQIRALVMKVAKRRIVTKERTQKTTRVETKVIRKGKEVRTVREVQTKVVTTIVQMTSLWLPKLSNWIKRTLELPGFTKNSTELLNKIANQTVTTSTRTNNSSSRTETLGEPSARRRRSADDFSTPFDNPLNYADLDFGSGELLQAYASGGRRKRAVSRRPRAKKRIFWTARPTVAAQVISTTLAPEKTKVEIANERKVEQVKEPDFEQRVSEQTSKAAIDGFELLLRVAHEQNSIMYQSYTIAANHSYILKLRRSFKASFPKYWAEQRDSWSKKMSANCSESLQNSTTITSLNQTLTLDEELDDSLGEQLSSYDRGARLGFTVGKFIGEKAAQQWPDPSELNTFTYDSIFLAGVGANHSEEDSRQLERKIVAETAKRVAFVSANREVFAKTIRTAYLNGAFIVPTWGVLHAQRVVAKHAAKEGNKVGYEAASRAAQEFQPKAAKFFQVHKHQRQLAAPYTACKTKERLSDRWAGLSEQISQVQLESELNKNISRLAVDCGQKSGTLMGALMGLVVAPEAFETYKRFRGSLEALESEFNQFKLGALRGYELGETWAYLNYTAEMNLNLREMKKQMEKPTGDDDETASEDSTTTFAPRAGSSPDPATAESLGSSAAAASSSASIFDAKNEKNTANTNNLFQFMVLNYGTHLVANHSRKHMLKLRATSIDEGLLQDLKVEAGDLIAEGANSKQGAKGGDDDEQSEDDGFEAGRYNGELKGEFNSLNNKRKQLIKLNIIDLGPTLEFADELEASAAGNESSLVNTPLTSALAKVGKMFIKFSVARRKSKKDQADDLSRYLNANQFDEGDGYLCGTFSQLTSKLANGSSVQVEDQNHLSGEQDDFSLEVTTMDELFKRIEEAPGEVKTVNLVEKLMSVTTVAPTSVEVVSSTSAAPSSTEAGSKGKRPNTHKPRRSATSPPKEKVNSQGDLKELEETTTSTTSTTTTSTTTAQPTSDEPDNN